MAFVVAAYSVKVKSMTATPLFVSERKGRLMGCRLTRKSFFGITYDGFTAHEWVVSRVIKRDSYLWAVHQNCAHCSAIRTLNLTRYAMFRLLGFVPDTGDRGTIFRDELEAQVQAHKELDNGNKS